MRDGKRCVEELTALMGFMLLMGIVHLPSLPDYWKRDVVRHYAPVATRISRNRFFDLQRYLHFADNTTLAAPGTMHRVQQAREDPASS